MGIIPKIRQKRTKETKMSSEKFGADGVTLGVEGRLDVLYKQHLVY